MTEKQKMKKSIIILSILLFMLLSACTRQVGWVGMNYGNTYNATYQLFDGIQTESIQIDAGEKFSLAYEVAVDDGALTLQMVSPDKDVAWEAVFLGDSADIFSFTPEESGRYTLKILGDNTQGGFDLEWDITD
jgi:hypothetical protein